MTIKEGKGSGPWIFLEPCEPCEACVAREVHDTRLNFLTQPTAAIVEFDLIHEKRSRR